MQAETIIHHYNRLNGNSITREKLKQFHSRVQTELDANAHGPYVKDLRGILTRVTDTLKKDFDVISKIGLTVIDTKKHSGEILRVASGYEEKKQQSPVDSRQSDSKVVAETISLSKIHTDTKRFQNRMDAFSEASANSVAENYDPNKFDPIVIWKDPANKKLYVLSGHSRYEGMKRRGAKDIAARYFKGSEEQAIKFAKVEANRAANQESLIEDLAAYKLMRDGDESKGIKKLTKTELAKIFKGKVQKFDAYSFLSSGGLFVNALNQGTTSNYPYLERNAQWVGQLRNQHPVISNAGEDNIFHYFYSDKTGRNLKQSKEEFFKLATRKINQLGKGEGVLFPECSSDGCAKVNDKETDPIKGESYKRLREVSEQLNAITEKLNSKNPNIRVTTDQEKKYLRDTAQRLQSEKEKIQRDLDIMDKSQSSLFGVKKKDLKGPQFDAFDIQPKKKHKGPLNELQMAQLQDAIKAGRTPKVNLKAKVNVKQKPAPLFDEPVNNPKQASLFGMKNKKAPSTQSGVNYSYKVVELGNYKKDFHRMFSDTIVQIHGMPGHGKTVYLLKKAQYRAQHTNDNVLYVAREEYGRSVFDMKLKEHNIGHKNLRFCKTLTPQDLKWATVVFLDSVTALKLTHEDIETLADQYPNRNWFVVLQSTKNGDFRGSQEWEHLVDIAGEVRNRNLILRKNRLDPNNSTKMDKLLTDDAIQEAKKKKVIREAVKDAQPKAVEEPKQIAA